MDRLTRRNTQPERNSEPLLNRPSLEISKTPPSELGLGKPRGKPKIYNRDLVAVVVSLSCLAISICVVTPALNWAWKLGSEYQLIVIGFLLSVENLCLQRLLPMTFIIIEARWGRSILQNYDAILRNTALGNRVGKMWRVIILLFICLPTGLSVSYKLFINGKSTTPIPSDIQNRLYGLVPLSQESNEIAANFNNSPYLYINATTDFSEKSANDGEFPQASIANGTAIPYGYNLLLLGNESAAALDLPDPSYIDSIQGILRDTESWTISASVYGLVSRINYTVESLRSDDDFWEHLLDDTSGGFLGLSSFGLFSNSKSIGMLPFLPNQYKEASCFLGVYGPSATFWNGYYRNATDPDVQTFRNYTSQFTTHRQLCHATWKITKSSISLQDGDCPLDEEHINSAIFSSTNARLFAPFVLDSLPILSHSLGSFDLFQSRIQSPWKIPSYALAVATTYWSRSVYLLFNGNFDRINRATLSSDFVYAPMNETITSTVNTVRADPLLYFIFAIQPFITVFLLIFNTICYSKPFGEGFNLVSIIAGLDPSGLPLLSGAGFSGELKQPIIMSICEEESCIKYTMHQGKHRAELPVLIKGKVYY
ncbi:hypothetical protein F4806DRAFT_471406 [Annulohypoxylon nitens]|nr:hypothetical protein F4806DRAFT_471406 [Annulohypoxylon nitens]